MNKSEKIGPRCRLERRPSGTYRVGFYGRGKYKWINLHTTNRPRATAEAYDLFRQWQQGTFDP
jgi:hypothetical protein